MKHTNGTLEQEGLDKIAALFKIEKEIEKHTAFRYALNHKKGLSEYLNDGCLPMTNSLDPYLYLSTIFKYLPSQNLVKETELIDKFLP